MKSMLMMLVVLVIAVSVQAALVPNGDFAMYRPGTSNLIKAEFAPGNAWTTGIGAGVLINGDGVIYQDDLTLGMVVDVPGWIIPGVSYSANGLMSNVPDLFSLGYDETDGTSALNVFGAWSGGNGGLAQSAAPLNVPAGPIMISAMFQGNPQPIMFELLVDGVVIAPDAATNPADPGGGDWRELTRTYNSVPAGDVRILVGVPNGKLPEGGHTLTGSRLKIDNVSVIAVPEPATMVLLGLGGLSLIRRRRKA